jgi:hypothetical protein
MQRRRRPQGWGPLLFALLLLLALAPIVAHAQGVDSVTVSWTAPGDDGQIGTATAYELRMSTSAINSSNWANAGIVPGSPTPRASGTRQSAVVRGLTRGTTYWFAIKTVDEAGNWSNVSNIVQWDWVVDTAPPSAPTGVAATQESDGTVRVNWSPNSEADLAGYDVYRAFNAGGPFTNINGSTVTATEYLDDTVPAGTETVWYQITASDNSGNRSARSSTASVSLVVQVAAWALETGYPNPSTAGTTVRIPVVVPGSGGGAVMEIINDSGQRVRRLDLGTLSPGATEVPWDGRNDGNREVAPGVYTAWLIAGSTRVSVRLVRVP